ncbi:MAG TPA: 2OG-Fe(II) oxygenase [Thermoanaerobaculia bacterium]
MIELQVDPRALRESYRAATPFPHAAIDGLFSDAVLDGVLADFPRPEETEWVRFDNAHEKKLGFRHDSTRISARVRDFLCFMNSYEMLGFLEELTGIDGLIPDPYYGGGGLHQIERGGFLEVHVDFNWHPKLRLDRRLNVLVFLNKEWKEEYGGHLELWNGAECITRILPRFNRTVVFSTTDRSFHGHPHPLGSPAEITRKSVSLYYYTNGRPHEEQSPPHDTIFRP